MRKFKFSGVDPRPVRSRGGLFGVRFAACGRCGVVIPETELTPIPTSAPPGSTRVLVCKNCR